MKKYDVALLFGGNLGVQTDTFWLATKQISEFAEVIKASSYWKSHPWGVEEEQPDFINQCLHIRTELEPNELLARLQQIETELGREDKGKNLPRSIDIDIIWIDKLIWFSPQLQVPHRSLALRRFALEPFAEILPNARHLYLQKTALEMLNECEDRLLVSKIQTV